MKKIFSLILLTAIIYSGYAQNRRTSTSTTPAKPATTSTTKSTSGTSTTTKSTDSKTNTSEKLASTEPEVASSAKTPFFTPPSPMTLMSTNIEFGGYPSDAEVSFVNVYGLLGLNFDFSRKFYAGPYFKYKILSTTDYQVMNIDGKDLDLSSFNEWGLGANFGAYLPLGKTLLITPELRFGYNEYNIQDLSFNSTNKNFLNHKYLSFIPRLNIGFKMSDYTVLNFSGGYILPYYLNSAKSTGAYNPATFMYGIALRFYLVK